MKKNKKKPEAVLSLAKINLERRINE